MDRTIKPWDQTTRAATINTISCSGGELCLTGVQGIDIGGATYDVNFAYGKFDALHTLRSFPYFGDTAWAMTAANTLAGYLTSVPDRIFTTVYTNTYGIAVQYAGAPWPPNSVIDAIGTTVVSTGPNVGYWQVQGPGYGNLDAATQEAVFAAFTQVTPIPLPSSLPLFITGLFGLGWVARRKAHIR